MPAKPLEGNRAHGGSPAQRSLGYRPALDGLRGIAILGVLLVHSSIWGAVPAVLPGGDLGVTIFFVLSGYLITRLLLDEHLALGRIDLRAFYLRRAARLLPGLLVILLAYTVVFARQLSPAELGLTVGAALLYLGSFVQSIWGAMGNLGWTWSLSVEEHFYAVWPPFLRWLLHHPGARGPGLRGWLRSHPLVLAGGLAALIAASATVVRIAVTGTLRGDEFAYYSTLTRIDGIAVGCLVALVGHRHRLAVPVAAGWAALVVIGWCYRNPAFAIGQDELDLYGLPIGALATVLLVATVVDRPHCSLARMLSCSPLVHVGKVSYGLYLWNLLPGQTFRLLEGRHPGILGTVGCALVMVVVVEVSYWYVERPLLRWAKRRLERAGQRRPDRVAGATTVPATR